MVVLSFFSPFFLKIREDEANQFGDYFSDGRKNTPTSDQRYSYKNSSWWHLRCRNAPIAGLFGTLFWGPNVWTRTGVAHDLRHVAMFFVPFFIGCPKNHFRFWNIRTLSWDEGRWCWPSGSYSVWGSFINFLIWKVFIGTEIERLPQLAISNCWSNTKLGCLILEDDFGCHHCQFGDFNSHNTCGQRGEM